MISVADIPSHLQKIAFNEDASAFELLQIALAFGLLWFVVFSIVGEILGRWSYSKQWLIDSVEREYERNTKKFLDDAGVVHKKEDQIENMRRDWAFMQVSYLRARGLLSGLLRRAALPPRSWHCSTELGRFSVYPPCLITETRAGAQVLLPLRY